MKLTLLSMPTIQSVVAAIAATLLSMIGTSPSGFGRRSMTMPKKSAMPASANWLMNCQRALSSRRSSR